MSFDAIAPHYRWMELLLAGAKLQRCRVAFLDKARRAENILLLGEGHGRFLSELLVANPSAHITCLDASAGMLKQAEKAVPESAL
ncbi:MAG TPA: class I SAM-dependent methyltransferase, partial [Verrucomicrobiae bacterium]